MKLRFCLFLLGLGICSLVYGGAFQLYSESSAETLGLAGSVLGRDGMISNAWYNPAGTTSIERPSIMAGLSGLLLNVDYESSLGEDSLQRRVRPTGYLYGVLPLADSVTLNLSLNAPYGMISEWENDWQEANMATYTNLRAIYLSPSLAWKLNDQLSVAAGINLVYATARLARNLPFPTGNKLYMTAETFALGYNFSALYKPHEDWHIGLHYQSRVKLDMDDAKAYYRKPGAHPTGYPGVNAYFIEDDCGTEIVLPSSFGIGIANHSFEKWILSFDAIWTEWSTYSNNDIYFFSQPGYTGTTPPHGKYTAHKPKDWDDVWAFRFGASYQLSDNWVLRAGYAYDNSPDNDRLRSPEMPDSDRNMFAVGFGYTVDNWTFDFAYSYLIFDKSKGGSHSNGSDAFRNTGRFEADLHVVSAAISYTF